jgi:hypothetical protein
MTFCTKYKTAHEVLGWFIHKYEKKYFFNFHIFKKIRFCQ